MATAPSSASIGRRAYTVGQRQGLGVALGEPRYVATIDAAANIVTLGRREDLYRREFDLERGVVRGRASRRPRRSRPQCASATARRRCRATFAERASEPDRAGRWSVSLDAPAWAPAPGQAGVFYRGDEVIGGGRIAA